MPLFVTNVQKNKHVHSISLEILGKRSVSAPNRSPQHNLPISIMDNLQLELHKTHGRLGCFTRSIVTNFLKQECQNVMLLHNEDVKFMC